jgi:hypothetical protein
MSLFHPWRVLPALVTGACLLFACEPSSKKYPPWVSTTIVTTTSENGGAGGTGVMFGSGGSGPPPADAGGLCGNDIHKIVSAPPNVYFVLDKSGSMGAGAPGGTRYTVVQGAASKIAKKLEFLINVGAAVFPGDGSCGPGSEVFPVSFGDPTGFEKATKGLKPNGGTPTGTTLEALYPKLTALPGKTIVVLATDGGPNCNSAATCDVSDCMQNIEGCFPGMTCCALQQNCCAPGGPSGPENCVDRAHVVGAIKALKDAGIKVYVIGIPGSEAYSGVLADMALAGGAAIAAYPFYYKVDDLSTISDVLSAAAGSALPCEFTVDEAPEVPSLTNVYFDQEVVVSNPVNGWTWTDPTTITLHGAACDKLHSGQVSQVQIVSGCPTEGAK